MIDSLKKWLITVILRIIPVRWQHIRWQLVNGKPHEADIYLFQHLNGLSGPVLDLGANYGQFALSVFSVNTTLQIESWEPNRQLRWALRFVRCLHPWRFRYRLQGAGTEPGSATLHVPQAGREDLTTNASLDIEEFDKKYVRKRLQEYSGQQDYQLQEVAVKLTSVDRENLSPAIIKIDVEGWELQTLKGMRETLIRHYPMLMIELNNHRRWYPWLQQLGYQLFIYQQQPAALLPISGYAKTLNVFCLHRDSPPELLNKLKPLLPADWQPADT